MNQATNGQAADLQGIALVARELERNVVFTHVSVKRWRGQREIDEAVVQVQGEEAKKNLVTNPRWRLLDRTWQEKFSKVENKIRAVISNASPFFPIPGVYVVPRTRARDLFAEVDELVGQHFQPLVDEFISEWEGYVANLQKAATESQWDQIRVALPANKTVLRAKFRVTKHVIPMSGGFGLTERTLIRQAFDELSRSNGQLTNAVAVELARDKIMKILGGEELLGQEADEFAKEISEATGRFVRETARSIADSLQEELRVAVDNLLERIDEQGIVREGTLAMVERAFEKLRGFQFIAPDQVLARMRDVEERLKVVSPQDINHDNRHGDGQIVGGLVTALKNLRRETERDFGATALYGSNRRHIEI